MMFSLFVSCPKGLEYLLEEELMGLGFKVARVSPQGVYGEADLALIYRLCLWSRLANRVQLILFSGDAPNQQSLYQLCRDYPWETVFSADKTLAIEFHGASTEIRNTMFGAQVVKDGIADYCRETFDKRPTIVRDVPEVRLHAHLKNDVLTVSFDLTGYSLHQRGYRLQAGVAPLKENIAAAMLIRAKWPQLALEGFDFHDPFCGAGTLVIEAAMMAARIAPGLLRQDQSLQHWTQHQPVLWEKIREQAIQEQRSITLTCRGTDADASMIEVARSNAEQAGVTALVRFDSKPLSECRPSADKGLVACNPPYGERLGEVTQLIPLYQELGQVLHQHYQGWQAAVLTSNILLAKAMGLRSTKQYTLYNGAIECKLYCMVLDESNQLKAAPKAGLSDAAEVFVNRLKKNYAHLQKWAKRQQIDCYRVYDADLPEYAYAIDVYRDHAVLQEYAAPAMIAAHKVERRSLDVIQAVPMVLGMSPDNMVIKRRKQQKGTQQYQKMDQMGRTMVVTEGQAKFHVNLYDYLDTGLFLDHRLLRRQFATLPPTTRFLNCFCYTATASVHAALAGALTTNVDLSNTYLRWAEDNFRLNHIDVSKHQFVQYDCLTWLNMTKDRFDVIFLDPPSFSNSKRMTETLDIQRDHVSLINLAMRLLSPGGVLYFSTNRRSFKLDSGLRTDFVVQDISAETIDVDFKRHKGIHHCFLIKYEADTRS